MSTRSQADRVPAMEAGLRRRLTLWLLLFSLAAGFLRLGAAPVYIDNEAREGIYVRAMLETGNWVLPKTPNHVENGEIIPDKPPLLHWIALSVAYARTAISTFSIPDAKEVSRRFDEWSLRFPSALCGVLMVMSVAVRGRRILGDRAALLGAASLLMSWQWIQQSHYGRVDMSMAALVTLSMLLVGEALLDNSKPALIAAAAASGFAVLGKGPIGVALPAIGGSIWILIESVRRRSLRRVLDLPWLVALGVWAAVALPWYIFAYGRSGMALVRSQLLNENLHQYVGANGAMGLTYYLNPWIRESLPWNILGLLGVVLACRTRMWRALFCASWWIVFLLFFQISAYKRAAYLLPALPAGAMMCGYFLDAKMPHDYAPVREFAVKLRARWWVLISLASLAFVAGALLVSSPRLTARIGFGLKAIDGGIIALGVFIALASLVMLVRAVQMRHYWNALLFLWLCELGTSHGVCPAALIVIADRATPQHFIAHLLQDLPANEKVTLSGIGDDESLTTYFHFPDWDRIVIVPARDPLPEEFAPGYYLFSRSRWDAIESAQHASQGPWRMIRHDDLPQRGDSMPVVFVERRNG